MVATFFPVADIVRQVGGEHVAVQVLLPPDGDLHAFTPTARQMKRLQQADVVFSLGLGAEPFLDTMLRGLGRKRPRVVQLAEGCWTLPASAEHKHHDSHHHAHHAEHEEHEHDEAVDPHVWLSLQNAIRMTQNARDALVMLDPAHAGDYELNADRLIADLQRIRDALASRAKTWRQRKFIAAHGAYRYLAEEAGIEQVAVFEPLPGVEPSARWLRQLMDTARRERVKVIFAAPPASSRLVEVVAADMGVPVYLLDPLERAQYLPGESYQQRMMYNIETLERAMR
ncbi:MAG: metal ABC transporter substrate-binding protein [Armatimonadota bacterium]|nr:metal ABC transporter substrate-binding protein [bacterium]MDW8320793.1 metal ABC transporter substrate-binding protein [Armatimonadota bacterium]